MIFLSSYMSRKKGKDKRKERSSATNANATNTVICFKQDISVLFLFLWKTCSSGWFSLCSLPPRTGHLNISYSMKLQQERHSLYRIHSQYHMRQAQLDTSTPNSRKLMFCQLKLPFVYEIANVIFPLKTFSH